jgi:tetratricopeptide (TPR) repeat protein
MDKMFIDDINLILNYSKENIQLIQESICYPALNSKELIEAGRGNPRLMEALDILVTVDQDVAALLDSIKDAKEAFVQQLVLRKILGNQSVDFRTVLQFASVYRLPVTEEGLAVVCNGISDWKLCVDKGVQLGLLEKNEVRVSFYWVTPLLREELFADLKEPVKIQCHKAAVAYYQDILSTSFVPEYANAVIDHGLSCSNMEAVISEGGRLIQYLRVNLLYEDAMRVGIYILSNVSDFEKNERSSRFFYGFGWILDDIGKSREAIEYYKKALEIDKGIYGENRPAVATDYNNLGGAWKTLGDSKRAIKYCEKSYKIFLDIYGDQHPHTRTVKETLDALKS